MDLVLFIRSAYLVTTFTLLILNLSPTIREKLIQYGARSTEPSSNGDANNNKNDSKARQTTSAASTGIIDRIATLQVPHSWFLHFYVTSVVSSLFWLSQYLTGGSLISAIASNVEQHAPTTMTLPQVRLAWLLMALQGARRLYESVAFAKPSQSRMHVSHWALGVLYYLFTTVAIWIEGAPVLHDPSLELDIARLHLPAPSVKTFIGLPLFIIASGIQHDCHRYLASLKQYAVPTHPAFQRIVAPHYLAECLIYVAIAVVAAPRGLALSRTVLSVLCFVGSNLGFTSGMTRRWYVAKFGEESVSGKWNMVPLVY